MSRFCFHTDTLPYPPSFCWGSIAIWTSSFPQIFGILPVDLRRLSFITEPRRRNYDSTGTFVPLDHWLYAVAATSPFLIFSVHKDHSAMWSQGGFAEMRRLKTRRVAHQSLIASLRNRAAASVWAGDFMTYNYDEGFRSTLLFPPRGLRSWVYDGP